MKVAAIIQARMGSKRFPGKVLETVGKHPMLFHVVERVRYSKAVDAVVIATTTRPDDKAIVKRAHEYSVVAYTGPEHDVLRRYLTAATLVGADVIVRIPADNPLLEPTFIDKCVDKLNDAKADYCDVTDAPLGTGIEVVTIDALRRQDEEAKEPHHREHVNTYIKEHPDKFIVVTVRAEPRLRFPELRLTVDTKDDLKLIRRLYKRFYQEDSIVSLSRVIAHARENPELMRLNKHVIQKLARESELKKEAEKAKAAQATPEAEVEGEEADASAAEASDAEQEAEATEEPGAQMGEAAEEERVERPPAAEEQPQQEMLPAEEEKKAPPPGSQDDVPSEGTTETRSEQRGGEAQGRNEYPGA